MASKRPTPRYGHAPIRMRRRLPDLTEAVIEATPWEPIPGNPHSGRRKHFPCAPERVGDFYWDLRHGRRQLVVALPTSPADLKGTAVAWSIDFKNHCDAQWSWDGNEDVPTLTPSLHWEGVWHGWVQGGYLKEA